ncbi:hypothetical protein LXL04_029914 [Taraxacum kok-saghyz]
MLGFTTSYSETLHRSRHTTAKRNEKNERNTNAAYKMYAFICFYQILFWAEAFNTTFYLVNKSLHLKRYEPSDYSDYAHVNDGKQEVRDMKCIFLRYKEELQKLLLVEI